jgi:hypothetical protein
MLKDIDVAKYFLNKDSEHCTFTKKLVSRNGRSFYDGNARLNKYLHLAQNIYIAKTGSPLMEGDFYAYDNGAVSPCVQEKYAILYRDCDLENIDIPNDEKIFLDKFYKAFQSADLEELIQLSHEDIEWKRKHPYYSKDCQKMDSMKYANKYKEQYKDIVEILDRME